MKRTYLIAGAVVAAVIGFLLFRPDKLFADDPVAESLEEAFTTTTVAAAPSTSAPEEPTTTEPLATTTTEASEPTSTTAAGPVAVTTGSLYGIDHRAEGTATIYQQGERFVLRLEDDTDIQNGPDLYVLVLPDDSYESGTPAEYLDLGKLKGNVGGQNYELPAEFDPDLHRFVLIWCLRFAVPFAGTPLA
jgi:hypothetical protein